MYHYLVADWGFRPKDDDGIDLRRFIEIFNKTLDLIKKYQLIVEPVIVISTNGVNREIISSIEDIGSIFAESGFIWVSIRGKGVGFRRSPDGEDEADESLSGDHIFNAQFNLRSHSPKLEFGFTTNSDIWLPFNLSGEPQLDIYVANFDRILRTFMELNNLDEFILEQPGYLDFLKHTQISGYMIYNYKDDAELGGILALPPNF